MGCEAWVLRQDFAGVFVQAPSPSVAMDIAARPLGHMGGWEVGRAARQEVFRWEDYQEHTSPGDYTRSVILGSRKLNGPRSGRTGALQARGIPDGLLVCKRKPDDE